MSKIVWETRRPADAYVAHPNSIRTRNFRRNAEPLPRMEQIIPVVGDDSAELPLELLILYRFGVRYHQLLAAWKMSQRYDIPPAQVLVGAGVIDEKLWLRSQLLLLREENKYLFRLKVREQLLDCSINGLKTNMPMYSASRTFTRGQCIILFILGLLLCAGIALFTHETMWFVLCLLALFYASNILLRGALLFSVHQSMEYRRDRLGILPENQFPDYSVLVALHKEESQVASLCENLSKLNWPKDKLDIKLVCESDDAATIDAVLTEELPSCFSLVKVPPASPRTKPKALNFALPLCSGEYIVLYDAEDIPHPDQLREAYFSFLAGPEELACLQAPLTIHNVDQSWLTAMFSIEYRTLFYGILPTLAAWGAPLPLGGTSNHFKKHILEKVGGWDPHNVTEDADLGIRLMREGYTCATISLPTLEEAPPHFKPWLCQRTRWIKGWMQTILVHNREPLKLIKDLGWRNMIVFQLLLCSLVVSALIHPAFLVVVLVQLHELSTPSESYLSVALTATSIFNLVGGYTTYGLLALVVIRATGIARLSLHLLTLPAYWFIISLAAWRALFHLLWKPHHWEKTPHGLANRKKTTKLG